MKKTTILAIAILLATVVFLCGCINDEQQAITNTGNNDDTGVEDKPKTISVGVDGNYSTIQEAIDIANSGDTIQVQSGTYMESLIINKSISLIGEDKNNTIINGKFFNKADENLISIDANFCIIKQFTVIKGIDSPLTNGINTHNATGVIIGNNIIKGFKYGIYLNTRSNANNVRNNLLSNNTIGIRIKIADYNNVFGNEFKNNEKGVYCCCGAEYNEIHYNIFQNSSLNNSIENKGLINYWNYNYWDDYSGFDSDGDRIGDTPYDVPKSDNQDLYPLMTPYHSLLNFS